MDNGTPRNRARTRQDGAGGDPLLTRLRRAHRAQEKAWLAHQLDCAAVMLPLMTELDAETAPRPSHLRLVVDYDQ